MDALLSDINQAGVGRGLQFELFKPGQVVVQGLLRRAADRHQGQRQLSRHRRIHQRHRATCRASSRSNNLKLATGKDGDLSLDAVAKTFRYLDLEEVDGAAQGRGDKKKGGKK